MVGALVVTVRRDGGGAAGPARDLVDNETRRFVGELRVADIRDLAVLHKNEGCPNTPTTYIDVHNLHLHREAVADLGFEVHASALTVERHIENAVIQELPLAFRATR